MIQKISKRPASLSLVFLSISTGLAAVSLQASTKRTADEIVRKHLAAIGPASTRASGHPRIIVGTSFVSFKNPPQQAAGRAVLASHEKKNLIGMSFANPGYSREQLGFNGNSFNAAFVSPGVRSALGNFLMSYPVIFKEGLMGGTLSTAWPLLNLAERRADLEYGGETKRDKRILHQLKYRPKGSSEVNISLFFDPETFQHVMTEYTRVIPAPTGTVSYGRIQEREIRYKMIEEFSQFKEEAGLVLPHHYKISLSVDSQSGTFMADWEIELSSFTFDEPIDPASFTITGD